MFVFGMLLFVVVIGLYIVVDFGLGLCDGLMIGFVGWIGWFVWFVCILIEGGVLLIGFLFGGLVGVGIVLFVFGVGLFIGWFLLCIMCRCVVCLC